ncbi:hypothetical protein LCGC14_0377980 [marine sediment metagenome]|uniref:AP2/ERF domain-containing protein n=1 Tax=marine sediment metagenome TaxID=412755 RepID=A0A0F9T311_9ZZZZ
MPGKIIDETGHKYDRLTIIRYAGRNAYREALWLCFCDCGGEIVTRGSSLRLGDTKSCGCLRKDKKINEIGNKYGRLTVINDGHQNARGAFHWLCLCDCGAKVTIKGGHLRSGATKSCGCLHKEIVSAACANQSGKNNPNYTNGNFTGFCTKSKKNFTSLSVNVTTTLVKNVTRRKKNSYRN